MSAWTVIAHTEVGSGGVADITFMSVGNIPSTYTDLMLVVSLRSAKAALNDDCKIQFNGETTNYSDRYLNGNGTSASSGAGTLTGIYNIILNGTTATASSFTSASIYIPNYAGATAKSVSMDIVQERNATGAFQSLVAGLWNDTDPITSIKISADGGNLVEYSSATLYGVTKGSSGGVTVS